MGEINWVMRVLLLFLLNVCECGNVLCVGIVRVNRMNMLGFSDEEVGREMYV